MNEEDIYFIEIYFDTSTFDKVEKDKKMTVEAQLGLIESMKEIQILSM